MNIIRTRTQRPVWVGSSNTWDQHRIATMYSFICASCDELWAWDMGREKDGRFYCPNDYDSMNARELAQQLAADQAYGASKPVRYLTRQQPIDATTESPSGAITNLTRSDTTVVSALRPLNLSKGGAAVTLYLTGQNLSSSDTIAYSSGISDNSAPVITATLITLSLVASGGMTAGSYSLTFNGSVFRYIFSVR